ncbi:MAG: nickel-responsive transcriptional regulator NikR [Pyrinomonadaceae bacterium]
MAGLSRFGVSVEDELLAEFDKLIGSQGYQNRSEALRDLMRDALIRSKTENLLETGEAIGSLTLVYNHHASGLLEAMTEVQHKYHKLVLSVMHLHVSHDDCLELIALHGPVNEIVLLSNALLSLKGVENGKLYLTLPSSAISKSK